MKIFKPLKPVTRPKELQTPTSLNAIVSDDSEIIKSIRIYEDKGVIKIDYRLRPHAKLPAGKTGNRFRFSTAKSATPIMDPIIRTTKSSFLIPKMLK